MLLKFSTTLSRSEQGCRGTPPHGTISQNSHSVLELSGSVSANEKEIFGDFGLPKKQAGSAKSTASAEKSYTFNGSSPPTVGEPNGQKMPNSLLKPKLDLALNVAENFGNMAFRSSQIETSQERFSQLRSKN